MSVKLVRENSTKIREVLQTFIKHDREIRDQKLRKAKQRLYFGLVTSVVIALSVTIYDRMSSSPSMGFWGIIAILGLFGVDIFFYKRRCKHIIGDHEAFRNTRGWS